MKHTQILPRDCTNCGHVVKVDSAKNCACVLDCMGFENWIPKEDGVEEIEKFCGTCDYCSKNDIIWVCKRQPQDCIDHAHWTPRTEEETIDDDNPYHTQIGGNHYKEDYPFCEPLEFFSKNNIPFTKANVCKYVLRYDMKGGIEDLQKAMHYLRVIAWDEYGEVL